MNSGKAFARYLSRFKCIYSHHLHASNFWCWPVSVWENCGLPMRQPSVHATMRVCGDGHSNSMHSIFGKFWGTNSYLPDFGNLRWSFRLFVRSYCLWHRRPHGGIASHRVYAGRIFFALDGWAPNCRFVVCFYLVLFVKNIKYFKKN